MWSGPRNLSTAFMRSFENRADTAVLDEPFFAPYLAATGKDHPGREETLAAHETDARLVAQNCLKTPAGHSDYYFQKHMPHQMIDGFDRTWMDGAKHFFLIRHPAAVINSYAKGRAAFEASDIGLLQQAEFYNLISQRQDTVPVIDSAIFLGNPETHLRALCNALDIPFTPQMLSWPAGPRETDGAWAPYWYGSVERSTGFGPPRNALDTVKPQYQHILDEVLPAYQTLFAKRLLS
ncbi:sulfotransferase-like domain-containing protein [Robiginitomaculum antarcticum]|uniref:sulfotransferase-like domain-containing protein n=1 Tax=Robiginitomaculum antarcticum TaxID=437507 RepID=UPI00037E6693|nr:hypothetical protein [Robiginitomaculum antarcticum]